MRPLVDYVLPLENDWPGELVTVVMPEIVPKHWWEHLLHNKTALYIRTAFLFRPRIVVTSVAFHLGAAHRIRDLLDHDPCHRGQRGRGSCGRCARTRISKVGHGTH